MRRILTATVAGRISLLGAAVAIPCGQVAAQTVVSFDDLSAEAPMPAIYGGIYWLPGTGVPDPYFGLNWWSWNSSGNSGFPPESPPNVVFSYSDAAPMAFVDGEVYFVGAFISGTGGGFWNLYLDGTLVHTSTVLAPSNDFGPVFLPSGWTGLVDRVEWVAHPGWTTLDDVTYSTVPEPATMTLIAIGAAGLAATHRRRKQA